MRPAPPKERRCTTRERTVEEMQMPSAACRDGASPRDLMRAAATNVVAVLAYELEPRHTSPRFLQVHAACRLRACSGSVERWT